MEALKVKKQNEQVKSDIPVIDQESNEVKDLINELKINCVHSCSGTVAETEEGGKENTGTEEKSASKSRKFKVEKTDHWLVGTFKLSVSAKEVTEKSGTKSLSTLKPTTSTLNSTSITPETVPRKVTEDKNNNIEPTSSEIAPQQVTNVEDNKSNIQKPTSIVKDIPIGDIRKSQDCTNMAIRIVNPISSSSKNNCGKREVLNENRQTGDEKQQTSWSHASSRGDGSSSSSRKRKLHERSPKNGVAVMAAPLAVGNKIKPEHLNKASWNVWYSSRRRRGLSHMAALKLEDILNCIWNMTESDCIKYPISNSEYTKAVPQPMCLQTIGYKMRNRIYETIEQFVHDMRRIFYNSRLVNDEDSVHSIITASLSNQLDSLLEDHFSGWDFTPITGDPNEQSYNPKLRYLAFSSNK